jgi:formate dehydrogenase
MGKVLMILYDGGEHAKQQPGLLGTTENELGLRKWIEDQGHTLITTSDKEGENSKFDQELVDAEVIITTPFVIYHFRSTSHKPETNRLEQLPPWLSHR